MPTIKLAYCEIDHLYLRPNVRYIFQPVEGCEKCLAKVQVYVDTHPGAKIEDVEFVK